MTRILSYLFKQLKYFFAILLIVQTAGLDAVAQPLSAFVNLQNQIMVWDNGLIRKVDFLPPVAMKVGRSSMAYLDNARNFKIYNNGGVKTINIGFTNDFFVTDNLVAFRNANSMNVFENGKTKNLSGMCTEYYIGDSIVLFFDGVRNAYNAYYQGNIYPIENFLAGSAIENAKVSANLIAYDNYANQFRIFYKGEVIAQEDFYVPKFSVGRNTVAYIDANQQFKVFNNGKTTLVESFPPDNFTAAEDLVAFVSNDGYFKIQYKDSVYKIGFFRPNNLQVTDNIVAYEDQSGYLKVFYKGQIYTLETFYPSKLEVKYNSLAYVNRVNTLKMFSFGETYDVTNADVDEWILNYDVVQYRIGQNIYRVFYKGTEY